MANKTNNTSSIIVGTFPFVFYVLGLTQQLLVDDIKDNPFASFGIMLIGLIIYALLLIWFNRELEKL